MSTIHGHLGMWNPASSSSSSASWASSSSSASQEQCHQCLPFFHGIHGIQCIQCIHGKLYSRCKPCVSWCFMLQSSISGTMQIPNNPPAVLSLPSRQYQGTASDPFSWQARRLVPIISKNKISIIKETITKNNKDSIRQYSHIFKASNIYSNIVFLTIVLKQKGWDANQQSCESAQHFCFSLYKYLFIRIFWRWQPMFLWVASNFHGSFPSLQVSVPGKNG